MTKAVAALPKPKNALPDTWDHPALLMETARQGLLRVLEIVSVPITDDMDIKDKKLCAEMGLGAAKLLANVQDAAMRRSSSGGMDEILAKIAQERQKSEQKQRSENKPTKVVDGGPA